MAWANTQTLGLGSWIWILVLVMWYVVHDPSAPLDSSICYSFITRVPFSVIGYAEPRDIKVCYHRPLSHPRPFFFDCHACMFMSNVHVHYYWWQVSENECRKFCPEAIFRSTLCYFNAGKYNKRSGDRCICICMHIMYAAVQDQLIYVS